MRYHFKVRVDEFPTSWGLSSVKTDDGTLVVYFAPSEFLSGKLIGDTSQKVVNLSEIYRFPPKSRSSV